MLKDVRVASVTVAVYGLYRCWCYRSNTLYTAISIYEVVKIKSYSFIFILSSMAGSAHAAENPVQAAYKTLKVH